MPIPAARGGAVNDADTLTIVVLPAQAPGLAAALTDRTGRSSWCRSRSPPHAPRPRHNCGPPRNGGSPARPSWRSSATGPINSSSGRRRWNRANHQIRPPGTLTECGSPHPVPFRCSPAPVRPARPSRIRPPRLRPPRQAAPHSLPCPCRPAREAQPRSSGHRAIACRTPGCGWVDYEPWHDPASALGMRERPVPAFCWRGRQAPGRPPGARRAPCLRSSTLAVACGEGVRTLCRSCEDPGLTRLARPEPDSAAMGTMTEPPDLVRRSALRTGVATRSTAGTAIPRGPGNVLVSWLPCQCQPARQVQPGAGNGHRTIASVPTDATGPTMTRPRRSICLRHAWRLRREFPGRDAGIPSATGSRPADGPGPRAGGNPAGLARGAAAGKQPGRARVPANPATTSADATVPCRSNRAFMNPTPAATAVLGARWPNCWTPPPKPVTSASGGPQPSGLGQGAPRADSKFSCAYDFGGTMTSCRSRH
jgi:hypothetical protein